MQTKMIGSLGQEIKQVLKQWDQVTPHKWGSKTFYNSCCIHWILPLTNFPWHQDSFNCRGATSLQFPTFHRNYFSGSSKGWVDHQTTTTTTKTNKKKKKKDIYTHTKFILIFFFKLVHLLLKIGFNKIFLLK